MNNQLWGPITWTLFHVLIEKTKDESIPYIKHIIIHIIIIICKTLPCPTCREHSSKLLENYKHYHLLTTKVQLKRWVWELHNMVNQKLNKPIKSFSYVETYKAYSLQEIYNLWNRHFTILNHDLKVFIDKQNILKTKNIVSKLLIVHKKHFT